jgi:hypothetical protein
MIRVLHEAPLRWRVEYQKRHLLAFDQWELGGYIHGTFEGRYRALRPLKGKLCGEYQLLCGWVDHERFDTAVSVLVPG